MLSILLADLFSLICGLFHSLIQDPQNPGCNRGFSFVEYFNNACADYSRLKMLTADFRLDGNKPTVTWAEPQMTPNHSSAAAQVFAQMAET